jgi:hypothetical protein
VEREFEEDIQIGGVCFFESKYCLMGRCCSRVCFLFFWIRSVRIGYWYTPLLIAMNSMR